MKRGNSVQKSPTGVCAPADRASTDTMSRSMLRSEETEQESTDAPGSLFGIDGYGRKHYWQMGSRTMTIVSDNQRTSKHLDHDEDLIEWAIQIIRETGEAWETVKVDPPQSLWLTGEVPPGEFPGADS